MEQDPSLPHLIPENPPLPPPPQPSSKSPPIRNTTIPPTPSSGGGPTTTSVTRTTTIPSSTSSSPTTTKGKTTTSPTSATTPPTFPVSTTMNGRRASVGSRGKPAAAGGGGGGNISTSQNQNQQQGNSNNTTTTTTTTTTTNNIRDNKDAGDDVPVLPLPLSLDLIQRVRHHRNAERETPRSISPALITEEEATYQRFTERHIGSQYNLPSFMDLEDFDGDDGNEEINTDTVSAAETDDMIGASASQYQVPHGASIASASGANPGPRLPSSAYPSSSHMSHQSHVITPRGSILGIIGNYSTSTPPSSARYVNSARLFYAPNNDRERAEVESAFGSLVDSYIAPHFQHNPQQHLGNHSHLHHHHHHATSSYSIPHDSQSIGGTSSIISGGAATPFNVYNASLGAAPGGPGMHGAHPSSVSTQNLVGNISPSTFNVDPLESHYVQQHYQSKGTRPNTNNNKAPHREGAFRDSTNSASGQHSPSASGQLEWSGGNTPSSSFSNEVAAASNSNNKEKVAPRQQQLQQEGLNPQVALMEAGSQERWMAIQKANQKGVANNAETRTPNKNDQKPPMIQKQDGDTNGSASVVSSALSAHPPLLPGGVQTGLDGGGALCDFGEGSFNNNDSLNCPPPPGHFENSTVAPIGASTNTGSGSDVSPAAPYLDATQMISGSSLNNNATTTSSQKLSPLNHSGGSSTQLRVVVNNSGTAGAGGNTLIVPPPMNGNSNNNGGLLRHRQHGSSSSSNSVSVIQEAFVVQEDQKEEEEEAANHQQEEVEQKSTDNNDINNNSSSGRGGGGGSNNGGGEENAVVIVIPLSTTKKNRGKYEQHLEEGDTDSDKKDGGTTTIISRRKKTLAEKRLANLHESTLFLLPLEVIRYLMDFYLSIYHHNILRIVSSRLNEIVISNCSLWHRRLPIFFETQECESRLEHCRVHHTILEIHAGRVPLQEILRTYCFKKCCYDSWKENRELLTERLIAERISGEEQEYASRVSQAIYFPRTDCRRMSVVLTVLLCGFSLAFAVFLELQGDAKHSFIPLWGAIIVMFPLVYLFFEQSHVEPLVLALLLCLGSVLSIVLVYLFRELPTTPGLSWLNCLTPTMLCLACICTYVLLVTNRFLRVDLYGSKQVKYLSLVTAALPLAAIIFLLFVALELDGTIEVGGGGGGGSPASGGSIPPTPVTGPTTLAPITSSPGSNYGNVEGVIRLSGIPLLYMVVITTINILYFGFSFGFSRMSEQEPTAVAVLIGYLVFLFALFVLSLMLLFNATHDVLFATSFVVLCIWGITTVFNAGFTKEDVNSFRFPLYATRE